MKIIKWKQFNENISNLTKEQIDFIEDCINGTWEYVNGVVNVNGSFYCSGINLTDFKGIQFGKITESFACTDNKLTKLIGAPTEVGINFKCGENQLTSLLNGPTKVGGDYVCNNNRLSTLEGSPDEVNIFDSSFNLLTSLTGGPKKAKKYNCSNNNLIDLDGCPLEIEILDCSYNQLDSLIDLKNTKIDLNKIRCDGQNLVPIDDIRKEIIKRGLQIKDFDKVAFDMIDEFDYEDIKIVLDNVYTQEINGNSDQIFINLVINSKNANEIIDFLKRTNDKRYNLFKDKDLLNMTDMGF